MSDLKASAISLGGIGAMLLIAGLPLSTSILIGSFAIGGIVGIGVAHKNKK